MISKARCLTVARKGASDVTGDDGVRNSVTIVADVSGARNFEDELRAPVESHKA